MNKSTMQNKKRNKFTKVRDFIVDDFNKQPTDEDLKTITRHKNYFMAYFYQYALGAIVAGFAVQPLIKYSNPIYYSLSGFLLSLSIFVAYHLLVVSSVNTWKNRKRFAIFAFIIFIFTTVLCSITLIDACITSINHDKYCLRLQASMQTKKDTEKSSITFANMQCRIQHENWLDTLIKQLFDR